MTRLRPAFQLSIDGKNVAVQASWACRVEDHTGLENDRMEITIDGSERYVWPSLGAQVEVAMGYRDDGLGLDTLGTYWVDAVRLGGPPWALTVTGHPGPVSDALSTQRRRAWTNAPIANVIRDIASTADVPYAVSQLFADVVIGHEEQKNETDLDVLARLGRRFHAVSRVTGGKLIFAPRHEGLSVNGFPLSEITLERGKWWGVTVEQTARGEVGRIVCTVRGQTAGRNVAIVGPGPNRVFSFGSGDPEKRLAGVYQSRAEAEDAADAYRQSQRVTLWKLTGTIQGDPRILAEQRLKVPDLHPDIPTDWTIASVVHSINTSGFVTQVTAEGTTPR